jgi:hypothetical protein
METGTIANTIDPTQLKHVIFINIGCGIVNFGDIGRDFIDYNCLEISANDWINNKKQMALKIYKEATRLWGWGFVDCVIESDDEEMYYYFSSFMYNTALRQWNEYLDYRRQLHARNHYHRIHAKQDQSATR